MRDERGERGQVIVIVALFLGVLLMGVGIAIDAGQLYVARRSMQAAADSAAWAGAVILYKGGSAASAISAAQDDAALNGYASGLTVTSPPADGVDVGDVGFIEVALSQKVYTNFLRGAASGLTTVRVSSTAGASRTGKGDAVHIITTASTNGALDLQNSAFLAVTNPSGVTAGVQVDSSNATAVLIASGGITAPYTRVKGSMTAGDQAQVTGTLTLGAAVVADPFAADATTGQAALPAPPSTGLSSFGAQNITTAVALGPGIYTGGITVGNGGVLTMSAGIYVMKNGGFKVSGTGQVKMATGGGVLIYNTTANYPAAGGGCGAIQISGTGAVTIAPRTFGSYAGMSLFQDRTCTQNMTLAMTAVMNLSGTIYVPDAELTVTQTASAQITGQIVVKTMTLSNNFTLTVSFTPGSLMGSRAPAIAE